MDFTTFMFLSSNSSNSFSNTDKDAGLLSSNNSTETSLLTTTPDFNYMSTDAFGGKDMFGTFNMDAYESFFADTTTEAAGSVAYTGAEAAGSVAYSGAEAAGSVACSSVGGDSGAGSCSGFSSFC